MIVIATLFSAILVCGEGIHPLAAAAEKRFEESSGCALAMELHSGRIILLKSEQTLLQPRPAGSILKLFTTYALLSSGQSANEVFNCPESSPETPSTESCWFKPGHGNMTLATALANSCNAYFRQWLEDKNPQLLTEYYKNAGLLRNIRENTELLPAAFAGLSSEILVRPLDVVVTAASLFNGGVIYSIPLSDGSARSLPVRRTPVDSDAMKTIRKGLLATLSEGTGVTLAEVAGSAQCYVKTGTTGHWIIDREEGKVDTLHTDGWCLAVYPADSPRYLVMTIVLNGTGAGEAARQAANILKQIIEDDTK